VTKTKSEAALVAIMRADRAVLAQRAARQATTDVDDVDQAARETKARRDKVRRAKAGAA
jgi:hypothetical protein